MEKRYFEADKLSVGYDNETLIQDISFHLKRGEILTLIGPNGSGKSTILKTITRHLKKIKGRVTIGDTSMADMPYKAISQQMAVVLTNRLTTDLMTCWDLVATGRYPYTGVMGLLSSKDKACVKAAMIQVQAYDLKDRSFDAISDGQRQRVLLARAICQEPEIIILDEPTSFLDVKHKLELLHILKTMAKDKNITVIMSLHEIDLAQKISDKIMCVKGDRIHHYGQVDQIFSQSLIEDLYDIQTGSYNVAFGSVELKRVQGPGRVFVLAGGGTGVAYYRRLQGLEIPFVTGVIHEHDVDYQIASALAVDVVGEKAFTAIGDRAYNEALAYLKTCSQVLYTGVEFALTNARNADLLKAAQVMGLPIIRDLRDLEGGLSVTSIVESS